jgi:hypothetical protein
MARDGGHGGIRLDGGISADVEAERRILAISPQQHSIWGFHDRAFALGFLQLCLAGLNVRGIYKNR